MQNLGYVILNAVLLYIRNFAKYDNIILVLIYISNIHIKLVIIRIYMVETARFWTQNFV